MAHTVLTVQPGANPEIRFYYNYDSVSECIEGICNIYEEHLKQMNPNEQAVAYDISQLFDFIDQLSDMSCLVYQASTNTYAFHSKGWIKEKICLLYGQAEYYNDYICS